MDNSQNVLPFLITETKPKKNLLIYPVGRMKSLFLLDAVIQ